MTRKIFLCSAQKKYGASRITAEGLRYKDSVADDGPKKPSFFKEMDDVLSNSEGLKLFNIFAFLLFSILAIGTFYAIHFLLN